MFEWAWAEPRPRGWVKRAEVEAEGGRGPMMEAKGSESDDEWEDVGREGLFLMGGGSGERPDGGDAGEGGDGEKRRWR